MKESIDYATVMAACARNPTAGSDDKPYAAALDRARQTMQETWRTLYAPILADVGIYGIPSGNGWDLDLVTEEEAREWLAKQERKP